MARRGRELARAATLVDVAQLAGVSAMTASRALHRPGLVAPETAERVRNAVESLAYVPNRLAGGLSSQRRHVVMAVVPSTLNPIFAELVHGLRDELAGAGYQLFLGLSDYTAGGEDRLIQAIVGQRPDGIILTGVVHSREVRRLLLKGHIPVVETWDLTSKPIDMLVGFSNERVGQDAAAFFLDHGRRRPALVFGDDQRAQARRAGFLGLLAERGVPLAGEVLVKAPPSVRDGREAARSLLCGSRAPDCIFSSSDQLALGVLFEATALRIPVPEKLAIIGFGNTAMSEQTIPPLTVVAVDGGRIGREAARSLIDALGRSPGKRRVRPRVLDVGYRILERGTT